MAKYEVCVMYEKDPSIVAKVIERVRFGLPTDKRADGQSETSILLKFDGGGVNINRQFDKFIVTGGTVICHCDDLRYHQWRQGFQTRTPFFGCIVMVPKMVFTDA